MTRNIPKVTNVNVTHLLLQMFLSHDTGLDISHGFACHRVMTRVASCVGTKDYTAMSTRKCLPSAWVYNYFPQTETGAQPKLPW